jgi:hypothetical protein
MNKEILLANTVSAGALGTCIAHVEMGLAILVLITALYINIRAIITRDKRDK